MQELLVGPCTKSSYCTTQISPCWRLHKGGFWLNFLYRVLCPKHRVHCPSPKKILHIGCCTRFFFRMYSDLVSCPGRGMSIFVHPSSSCPLCFSMLYILNELSTSITPDLTFLLLFVLPDFFCCICCKKAICCHIDQILKLIHR